MTPARKKKLQQQIWDLIRGQRQSALADGKTEKQDILKYVLPSLTCLVSKSSEMMSVALLMLAEAYLPEGKRRILGEKSQTNFFELLDEHMLRIGDQTYFKFRGRFTIFDGDQLLRQKRSNVNSASIALKQWEWEWSIIRPLLMSNPDWLYEDAIKHLIAEGGLPTPPVFSIAA